MPTRRYFTAGDKALGRRGDSAPRDREAPAPTPLLTVEGVRQLLGLNSAWAVYWHVRQGMPCRRIGRALRFDRAEVDAWTRRDRDEDAGLLRLVRR